MQLHAKGRQVATADDFPAPFLGESGVRPGLLAVGTAETVC